MKVVLKSLPKQVLHVVRRLLPLFVAYGFGYPAIGAFFKDAQQQQQQQKTRLHTFT